MGATYNFSLGFAQGTESKAETPDRLLKRQPLQEICTGMSLVCLCLGFSVFGMLIMVNRYQADPNGVSGDSFVAAAGGIGAFLVGMAFLVAACLHWRFCELSISPKFTQNSSPNHTRGLKFKEPHGQLEKVWSVVDWRREPKNLSVDFCFCRSGLATEPCGPGAGHE